MQAKYLKSIRLKLSLTQAKFAKCLGIHANTVARYERGDLPIPKTTELAAMAMATKTWAVYRRTSKSGLEGIGTIDAVDSKTALRNFRKIMKAKRTDKLVAEELDA